MVCYQTTLAQEVQQEVVANAAEANAIGGCCSTAGECCEAASSAGESLLAPLDRLACEVVSAGQMVASAPRCLEGAGASPFRSVPQPSDTTAAESYDSSKGCCPQPLQPHHHHLPHRSASSPQIHRRLSTCDPPHIYAANANRISTCVDYSTGATDSQVTYGHPGWERQLTAHIVACSGSTATSRRASTASYGTAASTVLAQALAPPLPGLPSAPSTTDAAEAGPPPPQHRRHSPAQPRPLPASLHPHPYHPNLCIRIPSTSGVRCSGSGAQVVLPPALLEKALSSGVDLLMCLERDICFDGAKPLGQGMFGAVVSGMYRGTPVAVKALPRCVLEECGMDELETFVQEITVLCTVAHPNVVRLVGGCLQPPDIFLCEELCECSLGALLHGSSTATASQGVPPDPLPLRRVLQIALDVAHGLDYLHSRTPAIVHRDIKPDNILLDADGRAKISDFGLARCKYQTHLNTNRPETGTLAYMAPECFSAVAELDHRLDVYAFGVVLWEMMACEKPWHGLSMAQFMLKVVNDGARLPVPQDDNTCPYALRRLISDCWADSPEDRPTIAHMISELERVLKYCPAETTPPWEH